MNRTTPMQQRFGRTALNIAITAALSATTLLTAVEAQAQAPKYLLAWMSDQMLDGNNNSPLDGVLGLPAGTLPDADFVAVIDANPTSPTYGKVVNTAEMPAIYGQHLLSVTEDFVDDALDIALCNASTSPTLSDATSTPPVAPCTSIGLSGTGLNGPVDDDILGGVPNFNPANGLPAVVPAPSSVLNEAHHHSVRPYVNPTTGRIQAYYGGLISANVFGCDITDPLHITPVPGSIAETDTGNGGLNLHGGSNNNVCGLSVSGAVNNTVTGTDDLEYNPGNGHYYTTMMGAGGSFSGAGTVALSLPPVLTTPGGLQEFDPSTDAVIGDYSGVPTAPVFGHGTYANGSAMIGPKRYAPRVQIAFGGVDGNGNCAPGDLMTGAGVTAFNLCVPGVAPHNHIGSDTGAVNLSTGINEGPDTGLLAHPHGIGLRSDLDGQIADANGTVVGTTNGIIMTSDYADPVSLALTGSGSGPASSKQNLGTTIRLWDLSNPAAGPYQIIQMPDGNRHEDNAIHEEPEGLMAMRITHSHNGAFVASMCGGSIFYSPDITAAKPDFKLVYDFGACTGASVFTITQDDGFMFVPISGIQTTGDPIKDRDYTGEHNRRIAVLDIRNLLAAGTGHSCDMPPASAWNNTGPTSPLGQPVTVGTAGVTYTNPGDDFNGTVYHPNNGDADCPKLVDDVDYSGAGEDRILGTTDDHPDNETSRGGPHFTVHDENDKYVATSNYFVDLREFAIKDVDLLLTALGLGHAWDNGSGGTIPNAYPPGGPNPGDFPPGGLGGVHAALGIDGGMGNTLPGTGSVGDDTVCMMKWDRNHSNLKLDTSFNAGDANSPRGCIDMDFGDTGASWPAAGTRVASAGNATPHGMSFITVGSTRFFTNGEVGGGGGHHGGGNDGHH